MGLKRFNLNEEVLYKKKQKKVEFCRNKEHHYYSFVIKKISGQHTFLIIKFYRYYFIYKYDFNCFFNLKDLLAYER